MNITTMQEMLPIQNGNIGGDAIQTVDGRRVHAALEVGQDYTSWVKNQVSRAQLTENADFVLVTNVSDKSTMGRPRTDYHFTIDSAKNIALMSNSSKGKEVRTYFIACEKQLLAPSFAVPTTFSAALRLAAEQADTIDMQRVQLAIAEPKVAALNRIATAMQGSLCIRDAAKSLQVQEKQLKSYLFENKWVYNREGTSGNTNPLAFSSKLISGLLEHKIVSPMTHATTQVRVTTKGLTKLAVALEAA